MVKHALVTGARGTVGTTVGEGRECRPRGEVEADLKPLALQNPQPGLQHPVDQQRQQRRQ